MTDDTTSADAAVPDPESQAGPAEVQALAYYAQGPGYPPARAFAVIGCRVVALFVLYQTTVWLGYLVPALLRVAGAGFSRSSEMETLTVISAPFVAGCVAAVLLWWKAGWIADRMIRRDVVPVSPDKGQDSPRGAPAAVAVAPAAALRPEPAGGEEGPHSPVLTAALAAAGVLVLAAGLPELIRSLFVAVFDRENDFSAWWRSIEWQGDLWSAVLKCGLGFWLLLGSRGVARFVRNLRHADVPARDDDEGERTEPAVPGDNRPQR